MSERRYPEQAGWQGYKTSHTAAVNIERKGRAPTLRSRVNTWYHDGNVGTADECAYGIGERVMSVRPRVCELGKQGVLLATEQRRLNKPIDGGGTAVVWRHSKPRLPQLEMTL